jgi:hypothetical protein
MDLNQVATDFLDFDSNSRSKCRETGQTGSRQGTSNEAEDSELRPVLASLSLTIRA